MAEIQAPNGYEVNETIDGANDIMEIFQPGSAGIRRNKKALLSVLKAFFSSLASGAAGRIVTLTAGGAVQDSTINISDVNDNTTHRTSDGKNHFDVANSLKGMNRIVLTNYTTTGIPAIAADSQCEINGNIYTNPSEVVISGSTVNDTWYDILLTPSGTTFTASFIARGTGVWSDSLQGLYSGNNRVVAIARRDASSSVWIYKNVLIVANHLIGIKLDIGDWDMSTATGVSGVSIASGILQEKVRAVSVMIIDDNSTIVFPLNTGGTGSNGEMQGFVDDITDGAITLRKLTGGDFDGVSYDSTSFNRGWVTITYEV